VQELRQRYIAAKSLPELKELRGRAEELLALDIFPAPPSRHEAYVLREEIDLEIKRLETPHSPLVHRPGQPEVEVEVTTDSVAVEEAFRLGQARREPIDRLVEDSVQEWDPVVRRAFANNPGLVASRMRAIGENPRANTRDRAAAARVLARCGISEGFDLLGNFMTHQDVSVRQASLSNIEDLIDHPKLRAFLAGLLHDADAVTRQEAMRLAVRAGMDEVFTEDSLAFLRDRLLRNEEAAAPGVLAGFLQRTEPVLAMGARTALRLYLEQGPGRPHIRRVVEILAEVPDADDLDRLRGFTESTDRFLAGRALVGVARFLGPDAIPLIRQSAANKDLASAVIEALGIAASGSEDAAIVDMILELPRSWWDRPRTCLEALRRIGGTPGTRGLARFLQKNRRLSVDAMNAIWVSRGLEPAAAIERLGQLGIIDLSLPITQPRPNELTKFSPYSDTINAVIMQYVVAFFDAESSRVPCRHDELLFSLEDFSKNSFRPDAVREEFVAAYKHYTLSFMHDERLYTVRFWNEGDYYNTDAVFQGVNRALQDAGLREQFMELAVSEDQMAWYLFADPEAADVAAKELLLLLRSNGEPLERAIDELGGGTA